MGLLPCVRSPGIRFTYRITKMIPIHDHQTTTNLGMSCYGEETSRETSMLAVDIEPTLTWSGYANESVLFRLWFVYAPDMYGPIIDVAWADN